MIQPYLTGHQFEVPLMWDEVRGRIEGGEPLQCDELDEASAKVIEYLVRVASDPDLLKTIGRCDVTTIGWLPAEARKGAYSRKERTLDVDLSNLVAVFGATEPGDRYYVFTSWETRNGLDMFVNFTHGETLLRALHDEKIFIRAGEYHLLLRPGTFVPTLRLSDETLMSITRDEMARPGRGASGEARARLRGRPPVTPADPRDPLSEILAGHSVRHRKPGELKADIMDWLASTP